MSFKTLQISFKMIKILKIFFLTSLSFLIMGSYHTVNQIRYSPQQILGNGIDQKEEHLENHLEQIENEVQNNILDIKVQNSDNLKYILQWKDSKTVPFVYMGKGRQGFIERKCKYTNCFVTDNRSLLGDVTKFDVVAFAGPQLIINNKKRPERRSLHQKYVFASIESADNYPVCNSKLDNFFNWTWTYKLDSESKWGYIVVRNSKREIIGPKVDMKWMKKDDMDPVSEEVVVKLRNKTKAAAWFVSNCLSRSDRESFALELHAALGNYNLGVDVFGKCGDFECGRDNEAGCGKMLERDYYFYLSFENSFAEDYVTEKLLHGLKHYAVPVVYGGANYSRFLPDGIYLNARELGAQGLAKQMKFLIDNPERYKDYFRWRNHYSFHRRAESVETDDYCGFCALLNNEELVRKTSIYKDFQKWWTPPNRCHENKVTQMTF